MRVTDIAEDQRVLVVVPWWSASMKVVLEPDDWDTGSDTWEQAGRTLNTLCRLIDCNMIEATYPFGMTFDQMSSPAATMDEEARIFAKPVNHLDTQLHAERYGYPMMGDMVAHMLTADGDTVGFTMKQARFVLDDYPFDNNVYTLAQINAEREDAYDRVE